MSEQRILMNMPAGQRKPIPVPLGKKKVFITNLNLTSGQVEIYIPNSAANTCIFHVIPYNSSQNTVTQDIDTFGETICCYNNNNNNVLGNIELELLDLP